MENTCVLYFLPVIPDWKLFNLPQKKDIKYFSVMKQKREFQVLLEKTLAMTYLKTGGCSIICKQLHFSKNAKNIDVIFLSEINLLSLTLNVQEKHALKRRNHIIVFLKNISNDITYKIKNNNIYTKCEERTKWKIFYSLYEFLLLRYGTSIIGAVFYKHFYLECMLINEKTFLHHLTSEYINSLLSNSKPNHLKTRVYSVEETLKNVDENQEELAFNSVQFNEEKSCELLSRAEFVSVVKLSVKRKAFENISSSSKLFKQECLCFEKNSDCHKANWKVFRNIKACHVDNYMDILLTKGMLCDAEFSDSLIGNGFDSPPEPLTFENVSFSSLNTDKNSKCDINPEKQILKESAKLRLSNEFQSREHSPISKNTGKDIFLNEKAQNVKTEEVAIGQTSGFNLPTNSLKNTDAGVKKGDISALFGEFMDQEMSKDDGPFCMFKTAAGKKVNVSEKALKSVEQMFGDVLQSEEAADVEIKDLNKSSLKSEFKSRLSRPVFRSPHVPRKSNNKVDCDELINDVLAENCFEEISFDENLVENSSGVLGVPSLPSTLSTNVSERVVTCGKVRKSLGGRRSLKPYSIPNV